jgi:hypothetical protein
MKYKIVSVTGRDQVQVVTSDMAGLIIELEPIDDTYTLESSSDAINFKKFMSGKIPTKPAFKVGDKVRVVGNSTNHDFVIGQIVTVVEVDLGDTSIPYECEGNGERYYLRDCDLELFEPTIPKMETVESGHESGQSVQDDSWKVTYPDFTRAGFENWYDFTNAKLEPWVMKCRELEARNKELETYCNDWKVTADKFLSDLHKCQTTINQLKSILNATI